MPDVSYTWKQERNTAGIVMIPRIQEYFGTNPLVQTVTSNLHYATEVLAKLRRNIWGFSYYEFKIRLIRLGLFPILNLKLD